MPKCLCLKAREDAADLRPEFQHNCFHHNQIQFNRWSSERAWSNLPNCPCLYLYLYYFPCFCTCDSSVQNRERSDQSDSIFICVCKCHRHLHLYLFPQLYGFVFVYIFQICTVIASTRYNSSKDHRGRPDLTEGAPIRCWYQTFISVVFSFSLVTCILIFIFLYLLLLLYLYLLLYLLIGDVTSSSCVPFYPLVRLSSIAVAFGGSPLSIYWEPPSHRPERSSVGLLVQSALHKSPNGLCFHFLCVF